ncbi:MAG: hypothetical protein HY799_11740 [Nitrosomonadales bacterium]|jgi:hypothetical protein|nr:hypothetical protein [Nitrosomonadales bacterium]
MQRFSEIIGILGVLVFFGGMFWLRGPAVTAPEIWYGVLCSAVGALLVFAGVLFTKMKNKNIK